MTAKALTTIHSPKKIDQPISSAQRIQSTPLNMLFQKNTSSLQNQRIPTPRFHLPLLLSTHCSADYSKIRQKTNPDTTETITLSTIYVYFSMVIVVRIEVVSSRTPKPCADITERLRVRRNGARRGTRPRTLAVGVWPVGQDDEQPAFCIARFVTWRNQCVLLHLLHQ